MAQLNNKKKCWCCQISTKKFSNSQLGIAGGVCKMCVKGGTNSKYVKKQESIRNNDRRHCFKCGKSTKEFTKNNLVATIPTCLDCCFDDGHDYDDADGGFYAPAEWNNYTNCLE
eukprot:191220_1